MGIATATLQMRTSEEHRERLHERVKAAGTVMVMSRAIGERAEIAGRPMVLVRTADDTTMYVATSLNAKQADELTAHPEVTVMLSGADYALITGQAQIARDRALIDELWSDSWKQWCHGKTDRSLAILVIAPTQGSYWEAMVHHAYVYRLLDQ